MLYIAICDDKKSTTQDLDKQVLQYINEMGLEAEILFFSTPSALYQYMHQNKIDIIFMDLNFENEEEDGILWSIKIHHQFPQTLVLILTAYKERYKEGYVAKAFRFMTKPFSKEELVANLNACVDELNLFSSIHFFRRRTTHNISILEIMYFEALSGGSEMKTKNSSYFCEESLIQWENKVPSNIFFRCHKKFLVNLNAIDSIKNHTIILKDGTILPVSRRKWSLLKTTFIRFDIAIKNKY